MNTDKSEIPTDCNQFGINKYKLLCLNLMQMFTYLKTIKCSLYRPLNVSLIVVCQILKSTYDPSTLYKLISPF